jgi:uncharacterized protein YggE
MHVQPGRRCLDFLKPNKDGDMQIRNGVGFNVAMMVAISMVLGVSQSLAQQAAVPMTERTIRVTGMGEARVQPDEAQIMFAVETRGATAQAAGRENAQVMDRVIAALVSAGIPRADLETRGYALHPEYAHDEGRREPRIIGYRASNQVLLRTTQLDRAGSLIDTALGAGANRMDGISFRLRDTAAAQAAALRSAVEAARASAQTIASALGVQLGPILDASTSTDPIRPFPMMQARGAMMESGVRDAPTPIQPGEQTVHARISLVYSIAGS